MPDRYRAFYMPQVPMAAVTIETLSLDHAVIALDAMITLSIFEYENKVKPDYSDIAVIEKYDFESQTWELVEAEEYEGRSEELGIIPGDTSEED